MSNKGLDELLEGSWEKMAIILDKEMPVRKRRRWIIPILFFLVSGIGISIYSLRNVPNDIKNDKSEPIVKDYTIPVADVDSQNSNNQNLDINNHEIQNLIPKNSKLFSEGVHSNSKISNLKENKFKLSHLDHLIKSELTVKDLSNSALSNSIDLNPSYEQKNISENTIQLLGVKPFEEEIQSNSKVTKEKLINSHDFVVKKFQKQSRYQSKEINWLGGIHYTSLGEGYSVKTGPEFQWNFNKRYSFTVGIVPEYRSGTFLLSDYAHAGEVIKTIDSFRILNPSAEFDDFESNNSKLNSNSYLRRSDLYYLNVPLHLHWHMHSKLNLGMGVSYQILLNQVDKIQGPIYLINTEGSIKETKRFYRQVLKPSLSLNYRIYPKVDILFGFQWVPEWKAVNSERVKDSTGSVTPSSILVDFKQSQWNCFLGIKYRIASF